MDLNEETERATAAITALAEAAEATEIRAQEGEGNPAADNPVVDPDTDDDDQGRAILNCLPHCHWLSDGYVSPYLPKANGTHMYNSCIHTEWGVLSVARFCYDFSCELRGPAWAVGRYSISQ